MATGQIASHPNQGLKSFSFHPYEEMPFTPPAAGGV